MSNHNPSRNATHPPLWPCIELGPVAILALERAQRRVGYNNEFGALLIPMPNAPLCFVDAIFPSQTYSPGSVNLDPESVATLIEPYLSHFGPTGFVPCWTHSHHNMKPTPSSTDEDTFCDTWGHQPHSIMHIISNRDGDYARIRMTNATKAFAISRDMQVSRLPSAIELIPPWLEDLSFKAILQGIDAKLDEAFPRSLTCHTFRVDLLLKDLKENVVPKEPLKRYRSVLTRAETHSFMHTLKQVHANGKACREAFILHYNYAGWGNADDRTLIDLLCAKLSIPPLTSWLTTLAENSTGFIEADDVEWQDRAKFGFETTYPAQSSNHHGYRINAPASLVEARKAIDLLRNNNGVLIDDSHIESGACAGINPITGAITGSGLFGGE